MTRIARFTLGAVLMAACMAASADCMPWNKMPDGGYERVCNDDRGHRYCERKDCENCEAYRIDC